MPYKTIPSNTAARAASTARGIHGGTLSVQARRAPSGLDSGALSEYEVALDGEVGEEQERFD
jgi:hypothetical protein